MGGSHSSKLARWELELILNKTSVPRVVRGITDGEMTEFVVIKPEHVIDDRATGYESGVLFQWPEEPGIFTFRSSSHNISKMRHARPYYRQGPSRT